ncbi:MAG: hypothetical protein CEE38_15685 [Planctomycetes bacterium B3_Pla]|nr:MAG: hypothetical protein CEE38_15685 [Planctomycetes bacterium B3_Pla]
MKDCSTNIHEIEEETKLALFFHFLLTADFAENAEKSGFVSDFGFPAKGRRLALFYKINHECTRIYTK